MPTRSETLLAPVTRDSRLIEIGPSINPVAPKSGGWNSVVIDHASRETLVKKYTGHPGVDVTRIEPVDFVWTGGPLSSAVPASQHGSFDALIASHVIEHTPDFVAFLDAATTLLKPQGVIILAVPDKRYCFDYFQPLTTTGQVMEAHAAHRSRHTPRFAFDHYAYAVGDGGQIAWGQRPSQGTTFVHGLDEAWDKFSTFDGNVEYEDLHAWRFIPATFELLLLELARLGQTDWRVDSTTPTDGCEFFVWLSRGGAAAAAALSPEALNARRMALLTRSLLETKEQIDWLLAGDPNGGARHATEQELRLGEARRHAEALQANLDSERNRAAALEARLAQASTERDAVVGSATWRATRPVRRLGEAMPVPVRQAIRSLWRRA